MRPGDTNLRWSQQVVRALVDAGVHHLVISPGSRSTPLVLAALQCDALQVHVIPDERSAAFFALGLGKAGAAPAAVLATSGSAPAHWYPAVIEAASAHWPLLLLSADRPPEQHACGANQTVDQARLFGTFIRGFFGMDVHAGEQVLMDSAPSITAQAVDLSRWPLPGPVHINLSFREPLLPESGLTAAPPGSTAIQIGYPQRTPAAAQLQQLAERLSGRPGMIIAGATPFSADEAQALCTLAQRLDCPLLADPLSGLRFAARDATQLICCYDTFLRDPVFCAAQVPEWVLQLGAAPVSKTLQSYLDAHAQTSLPIRVSPVGDWPDPARNSRQILHVDILPLLQSLCDIPLQAAPPEWSDAFRQAEQRVGRLFREPSSLPLEAGILAQLIRQAPAGSQVFAGNSMVIRDCDSFLNHHRKALTLHANRGASGIDGNVSTVLGMAAANEQLAIGVLGDLALYHDMNGLLAARSVKVVLVVFNNGGGAIFSYLPQSELASFEDYWLADTGLDMAAVTTLYHLSFHQVATVADFEQAFSTALAAPDSSLIEIVIDRKDSVSRHRALWSHFSEQP
ncbi:MAG TPA: 2-succinyl-5-enolpyruvyl-6-hydroxy-3-cyclohexene-1-carboxylic-acid synthase [Gammaproteobacteria bacterium]|nr:2-succinyl-5-enolpyruvyl-6-hydroxy-3-cyclohexene-1-carboxylic-acid synthase [Gammaproteobacteria bacterium]